MSERLLPLDLAEWRNHPVTKAFMHMIRLQHADIHTGWEQGDFTHEGLEGTFQKTESMRQRALVLSELLEFDYETLKGELSDQPEWVFPEGESSSGETSGVGEA